MVIRIGRNHAAWSASIVLAAAAAGAGAQTPPPGPGAGALEEVTVTARRREENLAEVPLAITAFTGAQLERSGVENLKDLGNLTPGLMVNDAGAEFYSTPTIRGLSQLNTQNGAVENNVSVFFNGVYVANAGAINLGLLNLERIEVVKGPVSALYGRNAFAGAINYVTRPPSSTLAGSVAVSGGNYDRRTVNGTISGPLGSDRVRGALSAVYDTFGGSWEDPVNGRSANDFRKRDALASLAADLTDRTKLTANLYYGKDRFGAPAANHLVNNCGATPGGFVQYCGEIPEGSVVEVPQGSASARAAGNDREFKHGDLGLAVDLAGAGSVQFLAGYNDASAYQFDEFNRRRNGLAYALIPGPGTVSLNMYYGDTVASEDYSGELRWTSVQDRPARFAAGVFYSDSRIAQETKFGIDSTPIPAGQGVGGLVPLWLTPGGVPSPNRTSARAGSEQASAFGSFDLDFARSWTFSTEARYTSDRKYLQQLSNALVPNGTPGPRRSETFGFGNFRSTLRFRPSADLMLYASAANGTKTGGFNARATVPADVSYSPEKNLTWELGAKSRLAGGRVTLDAAVFAVDWKDVQILGPSSDPNNPGQVVKNFGAAKSHGAEIEAGFRLADAVRWNLGLAYTDPTFKKGTYDFLYAGVCAVVPSCAPRLTQVGTGRGVDVSGYSLPRQSKWQATTSFDARGPLADRWQWFGRLDASYASKQYYEPSNLSYWGNRTVVGLRIGAEGEHVRVTLWGDNLTNDRTPYMAGYNLRLTDFAFETLPYYPDRRTYGLSVALTL